MESGTIEIRYSPKSMIGWIIVAAVFTAVCGLMIYEAWTGSGHGRYAVKPGSFREFIAYIGFAFFGVLTGILFWRFVTTKGPVITLSRSGIRDIRVAKEEIPWSAIRAIKTVIVERQQLLALIVDPDVEARVGLTRTVRLLRQANRPFGEDGFWLSGHGLEIDFLTLKQICEERVQNAHANSASRPWG